MKVLVIGGTGLISTALTRQLTERGDSVTVYNRGMSGVVLPPEVRQIVGDRYNCVSFVADMRRAGDFDCVIDMIAYKPVDAASLIEAFAGRSAHVILCSTIDVYGKPALRYPITEEEPLRGLGDYAANKVLCEEMLQQAHAAGQIPLTIIRPSHTYGIGGSHRGHVIHAFGKGTFFLDRLRKGRPLIVHGDGTSLWASGYVEDVARGFVGAVKNANTIGKSYHVVGDEWLTWNRYHEALAEAMGAPDPELIHIPTDALVKAVPEHAGFVREHFHFNTIFDTTAAKRDLGYRQTKPFVEGMRETIAWVDAMHGFDNSDDFPLYDRVIDCWRRAGNQFASAMAG